jgi:SsrA-binding protein
VSRKVVATNRKARHDFDILDTYEAGISLLGSEVKSMRAGHVDLKDAYATIRDGEAWLEQVHIAPYPFARDGGHEPGRPRKLLMHRREIDRLAGTLAEKGLTLVALSIYFSNGKAKVELGLAKGRRTIDKRRAIRDREEQREMDRAAKRARR